MDPKNNQQEITTIVADSITDDDNKYIGFDLSTQQLKAIVIDDCLVIQNQVNVNFDEEVGEYRTKGGVCKSDDGSNTVLAPVNMWLKALDLCLDKLKLDGLNFYSVRAISGSAQQHGSVWWKNGSQKLLASLDFDEFLHKQLVSAFTLRETPIWMDSSTTLECQLIEEQVGGSLRLAQITGSRAYERFTGPQIAKIVRQKPDVFQATERITLISNFLATIFIGSYAPFDVSDASGMNLLELDTKCWSDDCLRACVGGDDSKVEQLKCKLGVHSESDSNQNIVNTNQVLGSISKYFVERHGFSSDCKVSSFTGDNSGSMAGFCVSENELLLSLGTSDTAIFPVKKPIANLNGHILRNPIDEESFMGLICFKNGSRTRERIRDKCANGDWDQFSRLLESIPRGNFGNLGFYFDLREIYPLCMGDFRFNKTDQRVESFSDEIEIRACIEGQFLRLYHHSKQMGLEMDKIDKILVTGGASSNKSILRVIADIFQRPVYTLDLPESACLGAAFLAKYATFKRDSKISFGEMIKGLINEASSSSTSAPQLAVEYKPSFNANIYESLLERYLNLEQTLGDNKTLANGK